MTTVSRLVRSLRESKLVPNMLTFGVLFPSANVMQQVYFRHGGKLDGIKRVDWKEVSRFTLYGGLFHAPLVFNWLKLANRLFPANTIKSLIAKVTMDQSCFAPVGISSFYILMSLLEGRGINGAYEEWINKFPKTWATGIFVWGFLQTINFGFVPVQWRTIFVGCGSFFWTIALAAWKHQENKQTNLSKQTT